MKYITRPLEYPARSYIVALDAKIRALRDDEVWYPNSVELVQYKLITLIARTPWPIREPPLAGQRRPPADAAFPTGGICVGLGLRVLVARNRGS